MRKGIPSLARLLVVLVLVMFALGVGRMIWAITTAPPAAVLSATALADPDGRFVTVRDITLYVVEAGPQPWRDLPEAFARDLLAFLSRLS
jgi:hypothetical protein